MLSLLLKMLHVILPFMFGPILAALLCVKVLKLKIRWPFWLSQIGLILLGVQIGSTFTQQVIKDISKNWLTIVFCHYPTNFISFDNCILFLRKLHK